MKFMILKEKRNWTSIHYVIGDITSMPDRVMVDEFYLMGGHFAGRESYEMFLLNGREGYTSICGHANIMGNGKIWKNKLKNVYMCDCGCGFRDGRLGCLCLETKEETYV